MNARTKLNGLYLCGILLAAGLFGAAFQSWTVFMIVAVALSLIAYHSGDLRTQKKPRRK